ncbi:hypothetical protein VNO77_27287 [Canavalia gladiata]|uniref:Uncharacterized protein n=1 Tax=Canavalia gladiata TaxID=3824 RepID=A0AAN9Q420_CANGL
MTQDHRVSISTRRRPFIHTFGSEIYMLHLMLLQLVLIVISDREGKLMPTFWDRGHIPGIECTSLKNFLVVRNLTTLRGGSFSIPTSFLGSFSNRGVYHEDASQFQGDLNS